MGGCIASRPIPQGDEGINSKSESSLHTVNKLGVSDSAKTSISSLTNGYAGNGASVASETPPHCGGGGLNDVDKGNADILPFFIEAERLAALRSLQMIERQPEGRFDSITFIMKAVFQVPISAITLLDDSTIHFHSRAGEWAKTAPRHGSFCDRILEGATPRMLVVEDAQADTRFNTNKYVTGKPYIRFYAGSPLVGSTGHRYGTLCVIDTKARRFSAEQYLILCHFAELATRELERDRIMKEDQSELKNALQGAKSATGQVLRAMDALNEAVMLTDVSQPEWPVVYCNNAWAKATGSDPEVARASATSSSVAGSAHTTPTTNNSDGLTGPPLQPLAPFWHMFQGNAIDPSAVAIAMTAARLGQAFTLSVRSTVRQGEVINLRFKPVSEPGRLGAAAMPQIAVPAGIGLDWMLQGDVDGAAAAAARGLGRANEPISADLTNSKREELAAALSVLSTTPLIEPQASSIEKGAAATVNQQKNEALLPEPVYYLGVVLNQGPPRPPPRKLPVSPFHNYGETTEIVVPGVEGNGQIENLHEPGRGAENDSVSTSVENENMHVPSSRGGHGTAPSSGFSDGPSQQELQAAAQLACSATVWDSACYEDLPEAAKYQPTTADQTGGLESLLGVSRPSLNVQNSSGAWGLIDRPPPTLRETTLGALIGCGSNSRCYRGVWKRERVAVKVTDMWRESDDSSPSTFTLPLTALPRHPNLVTVLTSAVMASPTGIPTRTHLEVWTVEEFCNRGQLGDAIECGQIHGAAVDPINTNGPCNGNGSGVDGRGGSSPRASAISDLRAILLTAHDVASAMSILHSSGTIHGALTSNNVLLTSDSNEKYRGWKACVSDYALVASEAVLSGHCNEASATTKSIYGIYANGTTRANADGGGIEEHPLLKFRGTTIRAMNRPPCAAHIPPDVLLGAPMTPASDVYSFGVLLWEMMCARRAWRRLRPMEVVHAVAVQGCRLPTEIKGVPAPVSELMQRCLAECAHDRPSFDEVAETLEQLQITMT
ncbi:hypothetical protein Ndes2526A_g01450 [Nannochloris sp. 'desiccata']|nr:hypothetical protein KSW81_004212 [Chlorella desiccata (nom. nud.)]